jgi:hypothetical protein
MIKYFFAFVLCFVLQNVQAQITWDTTRSGTRSSRHDEGIHGTFKPSIKVSFFYNESVGFEIGRVKQSLDLGSYLSGTSSGYYAVGYTANKNYKNGLYTLKYSADFNFRAIYIGIGAKAQTDFNKLKFYFVPAVGLYRHGTIGVYYARPMGFSKTNFIGISKHQFALSYNFTKDLAKEFKKGLTF